MEGDSWVSVTGVLHSMKTKGVWGRSVNVWDHNDHNGSKNCIGCCSNYDHAYLVKLNKVHSSPSHTGKKLGSKLMH